jgi:outer membrane protein OmpA-like peptidoglycan-associated protein
MRVLALAALVLAGCGGETPADAPAPRASAAPSPPARQIGTVSGLRAQTSGLTGAVSGFSVERTGFGTRVQLAADTLFDFDKAVLTPAAQTNLARTADAVRRGGAGEVTVIGHTDVVGEEAYNLDLSQRRAEAVAAWLRAQPDVPGRTFRAIGRGEADQIMPARQDDPQVQARNRRVVVDIPG